MFFFVEEGIRLLPGIPNKRTAQVLVCAVPMHLYSMVRL
jgi:hypothetical protein